MIYSKACGCSKQDIARAHFNQGIAFKAHGQPTLMVPGTIRQKAHGWLLPAFQEDQFQGCDQRVKFFQSLDLRDEPGGILGVGQGGPELRRHHLVITEGGAFDAENPVGEVIEEALVGQNLVVVKNALLVPLKQEHQAAFAAEDRQFYQFGPGTKVAQLAKEDVFHGFDFSGHLFLPGDFPEDRIDVAAQQMRGLIIVRRGHMVDDHQRPPAEEVHQAGSRVNQ